jgi:hypothetical protein
MTNSILSNLFCANAGLIYTDGTLAQVSENGKETYFSFFDLGAWQQNRVLKKVNAKVKRYQNSACVSISGLQTPEGAAGPSGQETDVYSPEELEVLIQALCENRWDEVWPNMMVQHNTSHSLTSSMEPITRNWSAKTRTVTNALQGMGYSMNFIPYHAFKADWENIIGDAVVAGLTVKSALHPTLGNMTLGGQLANGNWVVNRAFSNITNQSCEHRMVVSPEQIGEVVGYFGSNVSASWQCCGTNVSYAMTTCDDPRHINYDQATAQEVPDGFWLKIAQISDLLKNQANFVLTHPKYNFVKFVYAKDGDILSIFDDSDTRLYLHADVCNRIAYAVSRDIKTLMESSLVLT